MSRRRFTDDQIEEAVRNKTLRSIADVVRHLNGSAKSGTNYDLIHTVVRVRKLDTEHWLGMRKAMLTKGVPKRSVVPLLRVYSDYEIRPSTHGLKLRLIREGLKRHQCEKCGTSKWCGAAVPIALNHVNGNNRDYRIENLEILCPNCHAQTDTFAGKNKQRRSPISRRRFVQNEDSAGANPVAATILPV